MSNTQKRTPEAEQKVISALQLGHSRNVAAAAAGINPRTLQEWMASDEAFEQAVFEAESEMERFCVAALRRNIMSGQWTPAAWWLERRRPELYSRVDRQQAHVLLEIADLREELKREGIELSEAEILRDYKALSGGQLALPEAKKKRSQS